jgi:uncharacterized protein (UPF0332 family)
VRLARLIDVTLVVQKLFLVKLVFLSLMCIIVLNFSMSQLLEKSKQSIASAKILLTRNYYSSSVNRSYYGCLQYMLYVIFDKLKKDKQEFYSEVQSKSNGTHGWASKLISIDLIKVVKDRDDYKWFQENIKSLKKKRIEADYFSDVISQEDGEKSIKRAEALITILVKSFK